MKNDFLLCSVLLIGFSLSVSLEAQLGRECKRADEYFIALRKGKSAQPDFPLLRSNNISKKDDSY